MEGEVTMYSFQSNMHKQQAVKKTVLRQYRELVDAVKGTLLPSTPKEGWVRTVRKALDMSGAQLGDRAGLTRNRISVLERREVDGDITLNQLKQLPEALDCDFSYTLKPKKAVSDIMQERALEVAITLFPESKIYLLYVIESKIDGILSGEIASRFQYDSQDAAHIKINSLIESLKSRHSDIEPIIDSGKSVETILNNYKANIYSLQQWTNWVSNPICSPCFHVLTSVLVQNIAFAYWHSFRYLHILLLHLKFYNL